MTSDYGLLYRQPSGRGNPAFVFLRAATAQPGLQLGRQRTNAALDSFGGKSQKKVTPQEAWGEQCGDKGDDCRRKTRKTPAAGQKWATHGVHCPFGRGNTGLSLLNTAKSSHEVSGLIE